MKPFAAAIAFVFALQAATPAFTQDFEDYQRRQSDIIAIAATFGDLHHIRRHCAPRREGDVWRERMKKLVELEEPQAAMREKMVTAFNNAYRNTQRRFPTCDRRARDYAAARAAQADAIVTRLMAPLYEAVAKDGELPQVWRGNEMPVIEIEPQ